jgi:adenosylcobinamide-GDP ribazoletransferase
VTDALRLAIGTLTRLPTPPPRTVDRRTAGRAMLLAPLTALLPAVLVVLLHGLDANGWLPAYLAAALVVAATAWWSRGLHLDGLADTADGLAAAHDRDRALEVMRRSDIGPTGVVTLVLVLLVQVTALGSLLGSRFGLAAAALLASRQVLALACRHGVPAARPDGLGVTVAGSVSTPRVVASTVVMVVAGAGLGLLGGAPWYVGPLVVTSATVAAWAVIATARRRLGGITGDVLGATVELALAAGLVVATVSPVAGG